MKKIWSDMEFITSLTTVSGCPTKSENLSGGGGEGINLSSKF